MPSLDALLEGTFLLMADPSCKAEPKAAAHPWFSELSYPIGKDKDTQRIWTFTYAPPTATAGPRVTKLFCRARDFNYRLQLVAESIDWGPITVHAKRSYGRASVQLPLTADFVLRHYNSPGGTTEGKAAGYRVWKLPANTDISFQTVYGYLFYPEGEPTDGKGAPKVKPLGGSAYDPAAADFMPDKDAPAKTTPEVIASGSTVKVEPIRVVLVVSLVCCKERKDWDPGKTIGAGRLYPHVMALTSHKVDVDSQVALVRPKTCLDSGGMCHPEAPGEVGSVLFTDSNSPPTIPSPNWDDIFDYYQLGVTSGTFKVVRRDRWQNDRKGDPAWVEDHGVHVSGSIAPTGFSETTRPHAVTKKGFQGEFDNLHIAPRMTAKGKHKAYVDGATWRLNDITMAPFCLHDCLHVHWRWGADGDHLRGWDHEGRPFTTKQFPLVPRYQDVSVEVTHGGAGFRVYTTAWEIAPGRWDPHFHNGCAYGVSIGTFGEAARAMPEPTPVIIDGLTGLIPWPEFYWHLRYTGFPPFGSTPARFYERLVIKDLAKLRDL